MRHLRSILYAFVLCPAIWTLSAVGFTRDLTGRARDEGTLETMSGLLLLLLAGAAYAILLLPRLSPAGPALAGLVFLAAAVWVLIDPASFDGLWPAGVRKEGFDLTLPADGLAALLAVPLLCTALSARRWRERDPHPAPRIRSLFDGQLMHRRAGFDAIGLGSGEATQVLGVGRLEEATQVIPGSRPAGARTAASRTADLGRVAGTTGDAAVTGTTGDGVTEPVPATSGDAPRAAAPQPTAETTESTSVPKVSTSAANATDPGERTVEQAATSAPTGVIRGEDPDGRTILLDVEPGDDRTQVIGVGLGRLGSADGERTQVLGVRGGELEGKTQIIPTFGPDSATHAGERTTARTVTPPADNTQVLGIPVARIPDDRTTVRRAGADRSAATGPAAGSAATGPAADGDRTVDLAGTDGAETPGKGDQRPTVDLAGSDDRPTADLAARADRPTVDIPAQRTPDDEVTTVLGVGGSDKESTRPMTVGGLERPPDEAAGDAARRAGQTTQRRPAAVTDQPSRRRTSDGAVDDGVVDDGERTRQL